MTKKERELARSKKERDPIPDQFKSIDEAAGLWESHDLADYLTSKADLEVDISAGFFSRRWNQSWRKSSPIALADKAYRLKL
jgi:hypothetical protein